MRIRRMLVTVLAGAVAAVGVPASAQADDQDPPEVPATPGAWIAGVGGFVYDEPGTFGHQIRFVVVGWVDRHGTGHGVFRFRHALPDGSVASEGQAEVTCVSVVGSTALVTAVVPEGGSPMVNHVFVVKIIDGGPGRADQIETLQAGGVSAPAAAERPVLFLRGVVASPRRVGCAATVRTWRSG
ncbi:hypothetical protein ACIBEF_06850 [Micromonospora sp. NPDC050795]|uniref:hypothetical protein n=1 Tax=Micromonospora sp. NPDC050795 TaxID=3364282 RepID=UPI0037B1A0EA